MKKRILLIHPPLKLTRYLFNAPALSGLGTLYTATYLRQFYDVDVVDAFLLPGGVPAPGVAGRRADVVVGAPYSDILDRVRGLEKTYDFVLITKTRWWEAQRGKDFVEFVGQLRGLMPHARIGLADLFIGDLYMPPYDPLEYLDLYPQLDFVLHGAGEAAVRPLLDTPLHEWNKVPGLAFRAPKGPVFNGYNYDNGIEDLDDLPFLAYDIAGFDTWTRFYMQAEQADLVQESHDNLPFLAFMATRGCSHKCRFCAMPNYHIRYRMHSVEYIESMLLWFYNQAHVTRFVLNDPAININRRFFNRFIKMLAAHGFTFIAPNGVRADRLDPQTLVLMKVTTPLLITSLETPNYDFSRAHIKKGLLPEKVTSLAEECNALNLPLRVHYMVGMPGETAADINRTLAFALYLWDRYGAMPLMQVSTPIPGTDMFDEAVQNKYLTEPASKVVRILPDLFQTRSVMDTPQLSAAQVTMMYGLFRKYVLQEHPRETLVPPTYQCNYHCNYCMFGDLSVRPKTVRDIQILATRAVQQGIDTMTFEGGEPTIHPEFIDMVAAARKAGIREVMMETNCLMCYYPGYAKRLAASGVTRMAVTIMGHNAELHDRITQIKGSFHMALRGLRNLLAAGFRDVMLNIPLTRELVDAHGILPMVQMGLELGVRDFMLQYLSPFGRFHGDIKQLPAYQDVLPQVFEAFDAAEGRANIIRLSNIPVCMMGKYKEHWHPDVNNIGTLQADDSGNTVHIPHALAQGKVKDDLCERCPYGFLCTGFLPDSPRARIKHMKDLDPDWADF